MAENMQQINKEARMSNEEHAPKRTYGCSKFTVLAVSIASIGLILGGSWLGNIEPTPQQTQTVSSVVNEEAPHSGQTLPETA